MLRFLFLAILTQLTIAAPQFDFSFWKSGSHILVAVSDSGSNRVQWSDDGINWTVATAAEACTFKAVKWFSGGNVFVAVCTDGTNRFQWSSSGASWSAGTQPSTQKAWIGLGCSPTVCVALDGAGGANGVAYTTDGKTWINKNAATWNGCSTNNCVAWDARNSLFVAVSNGGSAYQSSPDGDTWTARTGCNAGIGGAVEYASFINSGTDVAAGSAGSNPIACISTTGTTWAQQNVNNSGPYLDIACSPALAICAATANNGGSQNVNTTADGTTWAASDTGGTRAMTGIAWSASLALFVAITNNTGNSTQVFTTATAGASSAWTGRTSAETSQWIDITASR
jgi:hypothetical protein